MAIRQVKGFKLEVTYKDGTRGTRLYDGFTEEQLRKKLKALGGKVSEGIREVHSITPWEWDQEYIMVSI